VVSRLLSTALTGVAIALAAGAARLAIADVATTKAINTTPTLPHVAEATGKGPQILVGGKPRSPFKLAVPSILGDKDVSNAVLETMAKDFGQTTVFTLLDPKEFRANLGAEGLSFEPKPWQDVGAEGIIKGHAAFRAGLIHLELRLYILARGKDAVLTRVVDTAPAGLRSLLHDFDNEVVQAFTQRASSFGTRLLFSATIGRGQKGIFQIDSDGEGLTRLPTATNIAMAPAVGPQGIYYAGYTPDTGYALYRIGQPLAVLHNVGLVFGAAFDGARMALVVAKGGQSDIYVGNADGSGLARVTNGGLNTHPAFGPRGQLAYTSNQGGNPQVYVDGRRVSVRGTYNMAPSWCADPDGAKVIFMGRDGAAWDIFSVDPSGALESVRRLTQDQGSNTYPACSPDGRTVAFFSTRAGGSLMTSDALGQNQRRIAGVTGESLRWDAVRATSP
jgi:TolB protein